MERIGQLDLLPRIYGSILAPPAVVREFGRAPEWLGESEAIALGAERGCRVILDDHQARSAAARVGVAVIGTVGVLLRAKLAGLSQDSLRCSTLSTRRGSVSTRGCGRRRWSWPESCGKRTGGAAR